MADKDEQVANRADHEARIERLAAQFPFLPRADLNLTRLFYTAFRQINDRANDTLAPFGLNITTLVALISIAGSERGVLSSSELSHSIYSARTNITRVVDELVGAGWVARSHCAGDRRKVELAVTDAGRTLLAEVLPMHWQQMRATWSALTPGEAALFTELLGKVVAAGCKPADAG